MGLATSQLPPLQDTLSITIANLLQAVDFMTYKYGQPNTSDWLWTWRDFHGYFKPVLSLLPFP
jgi:hypothetical protein